MKNDLRFVFDTNAIVSAVLIKSSISRQAFDKARIHGRILISFDTLGELNEVLRREKFSRYLTERERLQFLSTFVQETDQIEVTEEITACRDPKDDKFLELAVSGRADFIVSEDHDLQDMHPYQGISIISPRELLDYLSR